MHFVFFAVFSKIHQSYHQDYSTSLQSSLLYTEYNLISNVTKKLYNFPESGIFQTMMDNTQERHSNSDRK